MATTFKVLGQTAPTTGQPALITAQSAGVVVSSITVANRSSSATDYFYVRVAISDAASANAQYVAYKVAVAPQSIATLTLGITLGAADTVYAYSDNYTCSYNAFGTVNS